jgi:ferric-dicitrate binding protein FerR (iron transport regulator)
VNLEWRYWSPWIALAALIFLATLAPAQERPVEMGEVVSSAGASINGTRLAGEGTIFRGDTVETEATGEAVIKLSPEIRVLLNRNTSVAFSKVLDQVRLELRKGTVVVQKSGDSLVAVATPRFEIQPAGTGLARMYVALMGDHSTYVESDQGQLKILNAASGTSYSLGAGQNVLVPENASGIPGLQPEHPAKGVASKPSPNPPAPPSRHAPKSPVGHSHLLVGVGVAAAAAGGVAALVAGGGGSPRPVSPSAP